MMDRPTDNRPTDWDLETTRLMTPDSTAQIEFEARLARVETKQDGLYTELHAIHHAVLRVEDQFTKLTEGVLGAVQANPLLRRLLGGGK